MPSNLSSSLRGSLAPARVIDLLERVSAIYIRNLESSPEHAPLCGFGASELAGRFMAGICTGNLPESLPKTGKVVNELITLGVLDSNRKERHAGTFTFPVYGPDNRPSALLFVDPSTLKQICLGNARGFWNLKTAGESVELLVAGSVADALALITAGYANTVSIQPESSPDWDQLKSLGIKRLRLVHAGSTRLPRPQSGFIVDDLHLLSRSSSVLVKSGAEALTDMMSRAEEHGAELSDPGHFSVCVGRRRYEVIGLQKHDRRLKCTIRVSHAGRIHADTLDLYQARGRRNLVRDLCNFFSEGANVIEADIGRIITACEGMADSAASPPPESDGPVLTPEEKDEAAVFGRSPDLVAQVLSDFDSCGLVGEGTNKLLSYLAMTSRKMVSPHKPLCVLTISSSGAGKSALQDATLDFCPPEDLVRLTTLTGKALFYKDRGSLKHRVLAFEEGDGAKEAAYGIRTLISSGVLSMEAVMRDSVTGKMVSVRNEVEGPTSVFCTTTQPDVDAETRSRFLVTGIDESAEQTRRILKAQRERHGEGMLESNEDRDDIVRRHRNFQRLLKSVKVVNPYAETLNFDHGRLQSRRLQPQYLALIAAIAFLRQMGKEIHENDTTEFITVDEADLELGNRIAAEVLVQTMDDLTIPARDLLGLIRTFVSQRLEEMSGGDPDAPYTETDVLFTRRELREYTGWTQTRLGTHMRELVDLEYVFMKSGRIGKRHQYSLVTDCPMRSFSLNLSDLSQPVNEKMTGCDKG
ncbi:hypothetical protein BVX99_02140 [bacterium F16]|nr:hypothetical protein BVX99_02140 [bacterium F16]